MANITITIPDALLPRVINGVAGQCGYSATIANPSDPGSFIPNPQTKAQFAKAQIIQFMKDSVKAYEARIAGDTARDAALAAAESEITLT